MEVDNSSQISDWVVVWLAKRKALVEELAHEGPIFFMMTLLICTMLIIKEIQGIFSSRMSTLKENKLQT